ncbi:sugar kinase [Cryobacterium roopkundense]|uniref:Ribokinase n=1 Tax=Cryobacterium roopkundense TaxID=1001240 RepID=A0A099JUS1_9MICO|nr:ribokinase [Cryobacterium roopkundense]KGJ81128.1 sugar kinase [Cryobacterium roopkundense]MBB5641872.1 ribokinase [Cryobacterium roopkundense]
MKQTEPGSAAPGVIVVGSITADITTFSERLPEPGETLLGTAVTLALGGKGANQAVAAALAGANSFLVGCVGTDLFSSLVLTGLTGYGVDITEVRDVNDSTGVAHIRVDASGENDIVIVPMANSHLGAEQVDAAFVSLAGRASVLLTQLEVPASVTMHAIRAGSAAGLTVLLDPAPATALDPGIWPFVDIVTPNETEARILTGIAVVDETSAEEAGRWFCDRGVRSALITLASVGAVLVTTDDVVRFPAFPVTAVDTTAAGDAFAGYLGAALADGLSLADAIRRAMAAGALTVTRRGASPSLPSRSDVEELLADHSSASSLTPLQHSHN